MGLKLLPFRLFCLQAYATFPARADITMDLDWDGLTLPRAIAVPAFPLSPNRRFAPTALKEPNLAVAERDDFDCCSLGSFGLYGEGFNEFQHSTSLAISFASPVRAIERLAAHDVRAPSFCSFQDPI